MGGILGHELIRRFALLACPLGLVLPLSGCSGLGHFFGDTFGVTPNHNAPIGDSENMRRARGQVVDVPPLLTEPGDVWPGPPAPEPTLSDLQKRENALTPPALEHNPTPPPPKLPPLPPNVVLPQAASPGAKGPHGVAQGSIAIPNGNGTSTVIAPDGSVTTVPTPK